MFLNKAITATLILHFYRSSGANSLIYSALLLNLQRGRKSDCENIQVDCAHLHEYYLHHCAMVLYPSKEVVLQSC
jgi:hypothetical protein